MNPDNVPQIDAMRLGVDYRFQIKLRGFSVAVRIMTSKELVQIASQVSNYLLSIPESARNALTEADAYARETLKQASTSEPGVFDPQITDPMLDRMSSDELRFLLREYVRVCDKVNPNLEDMTVEDLKNLVDQVKKNHSLLTELSSWEVENVCRSLLKGD